MKSSYAIKDSDTQLDITEVAERLFRDVGFQKTTVADIARQLRMSPANVYRFFSAKSEISAAVCGRIFDEIEAAAEKIDASAEPAGVCLANVISGIERSNAKRFLTDRKLHELFETAYSENWPIVRKHSEKMDMILARIISRGMAAGEFRAGDAELAATLFRNACIRFCHPWLSVQSAEDPKPTVNQLIDFCLAALK